MQFGSNSAFGAFPTAQPTRTRRQASSGSFKEESKSPSATTFPSSGPQPIDRPNAAPSLGRWSSGGTTADPINADNPANGSINGHREMSTTASNTTRSFSSILSPSIPATTVLESFDPTKPFVYSRAFLLSLYDEDKARKRPIELAVDELGTREVGGKPWALSDWREGEKELFSTSIHPPTNRSSNRSLRPESTPTSSTLDLSTLATLPRDRDARALNGLSSTTSTPVRNNSLGAGIGNSPSQQSESDRDLLASVVRRTRGALGSLNSPTATSSLLGGAGVLGGVLGGLRSVSGEGIGGGAKEVWQGGRWRRGGTAELMDPDERPAARRFGSQDNFDQKSPTLADSSHEIPTTWDENDEASSPTPTDPLSLARDNHDRLSEPDLESHARSILGSLSLDSDPVDDSLTLLRRGPPGLTAPMATMDSPWQYRDPSGVIQGPFTAAMMHDWYRQSFFSGELCVRRVNEVEFETLETLVRRCGDGEKPFITAPLQPTPLPPLAIASTPLRDWSTTPAIQQPLDQFGNQQQRAFGSFYERPASFDSPQQQPQQQPSFGLDPWGASLPATNVPAWNDTSVFNNHSNDPNRFAPSPFQQPQQQYNQSQAQSQYQQQYQPPQQQQSQHLDPFGRPQRAHFDQTLQSQAAPDWQQQQQHSPAVTPAVNDAWAALAASPLPISTPVIAPAAVITATIPAPIGPPASQTNSPRTRFDSSDSPKVIPSAWVSIVGPAIVAIEVPAPAVEAIVPPSVSAPIVIAEPPIVHKLPAKPTARSTPRAPVATVVDVPAPAVIIPALTVKSPSAPAPWMTSEDPSFPSTPVTAGPSLRQIQEIEARSAEIRKASERQAAARLQALAAVKDAQRAAAAEAEMLPSSSTWAATPPATATPVVDPWGKKSAVGGKSMKEIQGEEEMRRKKQAAQQLASVSSNSAGIAAGVKGYAGSIGQTKSVPGAPWTTVAVKPVSVPIAVFNRPLIPGGPIIASPTPRSVSAASSSALVNNAVNRSVGTASPIRSIIVPSSVSRSTSTMSRSSSYGYDTDSPPPPSGEFMKWCREALKGLAVPMDEFIQMLLSFPLEASSDVLEIISDSVYTNSSTLDGRRFANDFSSRRKLDVSARYPGLVMKSLKSNGSGSGGKSSMAEMVRQQPIVKAPEWSVSVKGSKKKKAGQ